MLNQFAAARPRLRRRVALPAGLLCCLAVSAGAQVSGALGAGLSAAAEGRGGTLAAEQGSPLDAMEGNPSGLVGVRRQALEVSGLGEIAQGSFANSVDPDARLHGSAGAIPYGAYAVPFGEGDRWSAGFSATPESLTRVDWRYVDPPGTAGVSYGMQDAESRILVLRSAVGLAAELGHHLSAGVTLGLDYNTNILNAPYIFQQQPQLAGLKVLLDLNTRGFGWNGSAGAEWQPSEKFRLGAAWKSSTFIQSHGSARGSASALFTALKITNDSTFHYQAEVDNHLPASADLGLRAQVTRRLRLSAEGDWTGWGSAFQILPVKLKQGTNATINGVVGADAFTDHIALRWHNQGALHAGLEAPLSPAWTLRGGYTFLSDPVPSATLTPLTAAILRHALAAGAGWARGAWAYDLAYRAQLPASESVGQSALQAGEFSQSRVRISTQSLTVSSRFTF